MIVLTLAAIRYSNILNKDFKWPDPLPLWAERLPAMRSLIEGLLIKDPLQRLGTPTSGGITARRLVHVLLGA
jgi:hypothetical protein